MTDAATPQKIPTPIGQSPDHATLVTHAAENGIDPATVRNFLCRIRAPRTLPRFPVICARIGQMLDAAVRTWKISLQDWDMNGWPDVVDLVKRERQRLACILGAEFDAPFDRDAKDPFWGYLTHWAPYPSFGLDRTTEDERYLLAQAQLLFAYANDARQPVTIQQYEQCTAAYFDRPQRDPRLASYAVRQLSREGEHLYRVLQNLPVKLPPPDFARQLRFVRVPDQKWLIRLRDDLRNYVQLAHGQREPREGGGGGGGGGGATVSGHISYDAEWWSLASVEADHDDPYAPPADYTVMVQSSLDPDQRTQVAKRGDCPAEYEGQAEISVELPIPQAQRDPSSFTGLISGAPSYIQMGNQLFWFGYDVPTTHELAALVREAFRILRLHPRRASDRELLLLETATLAMTMLATSAPLATAQQLLICRSDGANQDVPLALVFEREISRAWWRMRAPLPELATEEPPAPDMDQFVTQPDIVHASLFVRRLLCARSLQEKTREGVRLFPRKAETYRNALRNWLAEAVDKSKHTTISKIPNYLFAHVTRRAGGDVADACFALAHWHELAHVPSYYAVPSLARLRRLYLETAAEAKQAILAAMRTEGRGTAEFEKSQWRTSRNTPSTRAIESTTKWVGNRPSATRDDIRALTEWLVGEIRRESRRDTEVASAHGHNMYTLYSVQLFSAALGVRWPSSFMMSRDHIDEDTGFALLGEKTVRPTWLVDEALRHFRYYHQYLDTSAPLKRVMFDGRLASAYFLARSGQEVEVTPSTCAALLGDRFPFPENIYRRFMRNELREGEISCPAEVVEAWLGHNPCGRETYHVYSQFSYGAYRQALRTHLEPILKDVGFTARAWKDK